MMNWLFLLLIASCYNDDAQRTDLVVAWKDHTTKPAGKIQYKSKGTQ